MPLHIDVKINDKLIERLHIARFSKGGLSEDSLNEYKVVRGEKESVHREEPPYTVKEFAPEPTWLEWEESQKTFQHRYGDDSLVCVLKALQIVYPEYSTESIAAIKAAKLEDEVAKLKAKLAELEAKVDADPF